MNFIIEEINPNLDEIKDKVAKKFGSIGVCKLYGKYIIMDEEQTIVFVGIDKISIVEDFLVLLREYDSTDLSDYYEGELIDVGRINLTKNTINYPLKKSRQLVSIYDIF